MGQEVAAHVADPVGEAAPLREVDGHQVVILLEFESGHRGSGSRRKVSGRSTEARTDL